MRPDRLLRAMFDAAVAAAHPSQCLPAHLPVPPQHGRTIVIGAGKAAAAMAQVVETHWPAEHRQRLSGLVITRYNHGAPCQHIEVVEAGHPLPDSAGQTGAARILALLEGLTEQDLVLCLISGGGSALLSMAPDAVPLDDKRTLTQTLLRSGATIHEINCVRKHLSCIKGGRLALAAAPARIVTLMISDVPGDEASVIASGPTVADATTREQAQAVLAKYGINPPDSIARWLDNPASETPKPGDPRLQHVSNVLIATPMQALRAAAQVAEQHGIRTCILGDDIEGEARDVGALHAALAQQCLLANDPVPPPCILLSGGETTVTMRGHGRGGRNAEYLLSLAITLDGQADTWALACDTDGIDGSEANAGAMIGPGFWPMAQRLQLSPEQFLDNNDAYSLFEQMGGLINTGPTCTNVNDFRAIFVGRRNPGADA